MLNEGDPAPALELLSDDGSPFSLADCRGSKVIVYFYPRAGTPGCTAEACEFRDAFPAFSTREGRVMGVSPDAPSSLAKFKAKYNLPFVLLSDPQRQAAQAFGVLKEKTMYGRKVLGIERTTFLIDERGKILRIFRNVKPRGHAAEVLSAFAG